MRTVSLLQNTHSTNLLMLATNKAFQNSSSNKKVCCEDSFRKGSMVVVLTEVPNTEHNKKLYFVCKTLQKRQEYML